MCYQVKTLLLENLWLVGKEYLASFLFSQAIFANVGMVLAPGGVVDIARQVFNFDGTLHALFVSLPRENSPISTKRIIGT